MNSVKRICLVAAGGACLSVLAACGGGGGGGDSGGGGGSSGTVSVTPPASASQSVAGLIDYTKSLVAVSSETAEPVDVTAFTAPTDDTGSPDPSV